jgi:hypothetical protein
VDRHAVAAELEDLLLLCGEGRDVGIADRTAAEGDLMAFVK